MDLILDCADSYILTPYVYPASWPEDYAFRQIISLSVITNLGDFSIYLLFSTLSYCLLFDHKLKKHPQFLENQVQREIKHASWTLLWIGIPTVAFFFAEVRGYSKLYNNIGDSPYGWFGVVFSIFSFLFFTDMGNYWIHRFLHHNLLYKRFHKPHHTWKIPTPFASHAFHPLDGIFQSLPYHIYPFLFPVHKVVYLGLFIFVSLWTTSLHDADYRVPNLLRPIINGAAHHTDHHLFFNYNYGQYFTLWDRIGGSYKYPSSFEGWFGVVFNIFSFLFFTDMGTYWIHRFAHHKMLYKHLHKHHHTWKIPTPFASHAVHPLDGCIHILPYHIYPFLFPVHKVVYLALFIFVNIWSSSIHDADYRVPDLLKPIINRPAHHTYHHLFFNYNYGQYFTLWDRIGGSYKNPSSFEGEGLHAYLKKLAGGPEEEKLQGGDEAKNK